MDIEQREVITEVLEVYLNHRLVDSIVDQISDRFADIYSKIEDELKSLKWKHQLLIEHHDEHHAFEAETDKMIAKMMFVEWKKIRRFDNFGVAIPQFQDWLDGGE